MFFNIGGGEILVIALVALIAVGPEQLPGVLRKLGRFAAQARTVTSNLRDEFMSGIDEVNDLVDPEKWTGSGTDDDPVVPRGYAQRRAGRDADPKPAVNEVAAANAMRAEETEPVDAEPWPVATADDGIVDGAGVGEVSADEATGPEAGGTEVGDPVEDSEDNLAPIDDEPGEDRL